MKDQLLIQEVKYCIYIYIYIEVKKAELDINFLSNCKTLQVFPQFLCFSIPQANNVDKYAIRKRLLKSTESKRIKEKCQLLKQRDKQDVVIRNIVSSLDYLIIQKAIKKNEEKAIQKSTESHENKLYKLTQYASLPFSTAEVIKNLSGHVLSPEQEDLLKNGLDFCIPPGKLRKRIFFILMNSYADLCVVI